MDPGIFAQKSIRENAEELHDFVREMKLWEEEMKKKERNLKNINSEKEPLPPVRTKPCSKQKDSSWGYAPPSQINWENNVNIEECISGKDRSQLREKSLYEKELGNKAVKQGKWKDAIFHYTEAISCYSMDAAFYSNRALCFLKINQLREAETDCTSALQLDNTYVKAYHRRATARLKLNQIEEAHSDLKKALELDPDNELIKNELNKLKCTTIIKENTIVASSKTVSSCDTAPKMERRLLDVGYKEDEETMDEQTVIERKSEAYNEKEKGNALVKQKKWEDAAVHYTKAIDLYPEDDIFYSNRALCFLKMNIGKGALLDCIRALEINGSNVKALHRKGLALKSLGQLTNASEAFSEALKLDQDNDIIMQHLNQINKQISKLNECSGEKENKNPNDILKRKSEKKIDFTNIETETQNHKLQSKKCRYDEYIPSLEMSNERFNEIISTAGTLPKHIFHTGQDDTDEVEESKPENEFSSMQYQIGTGGSFETTTTGALVHTEVDKPNNNMCAETTEDSTSKSKDKSGFSLKFVFDSDKNSELDKNQPFNQDYLKAGFKHIEPQQKDFSKKIHYKKLPINYVKSINDDPYLSILQCYVNKINNSSDGKTNSENAESVLSSFVSKYVMDKNVNDCKLQETVHSNSVCSDNAATDSDDEILQSTFREAVLHMRNSNASENTTQSNGATVESVDTTTIKSNTSDEQISKIPMIPSSPKTYIQFSETLNLLHPNTYHQYLYLKKINGKNFGKLFKDCLEETVLTQIIDILSVHFIKAKQRVYEYLLGLGKTVRFQTVVLFLSNDHREKIKKLFDYCELSNECSKEDIIRLKKLYNMLQ